MPPRYAYWTILAGGLPTAFRAADREDLLPTFRRLKEKHPDAEMKYFARGKLWSSPAEMREAEHGSGRDPRRTGPPGPRRGRDWRPGGEHRDPRQPFKDAKKARNQDRRQQRWDSKNEKGDPRRPAPPREKPHGDPLRHEVPRREFKPRSSRRPERNQEVPPRPPGPDREPPPARDPKPEPPPRPSEPTIRPPGPPERGAERNTGGKLVKRRRRE